MIRLRLFSLLLLLFPGFLLAQGVSCPAVVAGPDTTLNCNDCVRLHATPVSGFTTSDYTVQQIPFSPYPMNAGTPILVNIDDIWGSPLPIGFNFCFYGASYSQCVVGSNGVLSFDLSYANAYCAWPIGQGIPGNNDVLNSVLGPFQDIDPSVGGSIYWAQYGAAPCRVFVLSFYQIPMFSCTSMISNSQIVLYETTNIIEIYIQDKPLCSNWNGGYGIEGIQDATGTNAVSIPGRNFPANWQVTNDAYAFVPAGTPNYAISWYEVGNPLPIATTDTVTVCPPGNRDYYAEVVYTNCDGSTVTVRDTASINASTSNMVVTPTHTDVLCNGAATGTANLTITGNNNPYTILWSTGAVTANVTNLPAGSYTVTISEQGGCSSVASVTISQPSPLTVTMAHTDVLCNGQSTGTASVTAAGGTGAFTYLWSNGANTSTVSALPAGNYTVTVTDANNCQATGSVTIIEPTALQLSATSTDVVCFGGGDGTATAVATSGTPPYQYSWSNNGSGATISGLLAGNYTVTATDAHGCSTSATVTVIEPAPIGLTVTGDSAYCTYDSVRLHAVVNGGVAPYAYQWWSVAPAVNDTDAYLVYQCVENRDYYVRIVDQHGCTAVAHQNVIANPPPIVSFYADRQEACDSVTIHFVNSTTPIDFAWTWNFSDGTISHDYSPPHFFGNGIWSVQLTAETPEGCVATLLQQDLIHVLPTPVASFTSDPDITLMDYVLLSQATFTFNNTSPWFATSVDWSFGHGDSAFVGQVTYTVPDSGWFCAKMNAYNDFGCHDDTTQCILVRQDPFLWIPSGFTPNGDGLNDIFLVTGLEIVSAEMSIFDRWGRLIFFSKDKSIGWNGKAMDEDAPEGAYVFKVNAVNKLGEKLTRAGTVTLVR